MSAAPAMPIGDETMRERICNDAIDRAAKLSPQSSAEWTKEHP